MLWQELVTDGHVRAARLRRRRGPIIVVAIAAVLAGLVVASFIPPTYGAYMVRGEANGLLDAIKGLINTRLERARPLQLKVAEINSLVPAAELGSVAAEIAKGLAANGRLPDDLKYETVSLSRFWEFSWPLDRLIVANTEGYVVVGGVVARPCENADSVNDSRSDALRWIAIYRRTDRGWLPASLKIAGSCAVNGVPTVIPDRVAETLRVLLDVPVR